MFYVSREDSELTLENALEILPMGVFFDKICLPIHECKATIQSPEPSGCSAWAAGTEVAARGKTIFLS